MFKSQKDMYPFSYWSALLVIKVQSQKDICMEKGQTDLCPFRWIARDGGSEWTGKFHQSLVTKKR